ncbi:hypothetical protein Mapa_006722 [Marchantia paleacea]|nr:hypothetical protein Mapa_006722 [Marchantia paleacea]
MESTKEKTITTFENQRWAKYKPTPQEERRMSEVIHKLRKGKFEGTLSVAEELACLMSDSFGSYGLIIKMYFMVKKRIETMSEVHGKVIRLREEVEFLIEYYEESLGIRFANNANTSEYIEKRAVELMASCYAVLDGLRDHRSGYRERMRQKFREFVSAPENMLDIDACINQLKSFRDELMVADKGRSRSEVLPHLEGETVGLEERCELSTKFLGSGSKDGKINVLYLYGDKGVGKSRLLYELVSRFSSFMQEKPKTYILDCSHTGDFREQGSWLWPVSWQQRLIEQMADAVAAEGLSSKEVGKQKIINHMLHWKRQKEKVLLAVDNLSEDALLGDILPLEFSQYLPLGSCVIVSIQGNQEEIGRLSPVYRDISDIFQDSPECRCEVRIHLVSRLKLYEVKKLFLTYAELPTDGDENSKQNAVDNLIQRCEYLPLLVVCFGKYFRTPRPLCVWETLCEELIQVEDKANHKWGKAFEKIERGIQDAAKRKEEHREHVVLEKMGLLYKRKLKSEELQVIVGDLANVFNGWSQKMVALIIGEEMMKKLEREGAFELKEINARKRLPRLAEVTRNYGAGPWKTSQLFVVPDFLGSARQIYGEQHILAISSPIPKLLLKLSTDSVRKAGSKVTRTYRSLCLIDCTDDFEMHWFEKLAGLRYVVLHNLNLIGTNMMTLMDLQYLHLGAEDPDARLQIFPFRSQHLMNLKTLVLQGFDFQGSNFEMPPQLLNLFLIGCSNLRLGAQTIFRSISLQNLHIRDCMGLHQIIARESNKSIRIVSLQLCMDLNLQYFPRFLSKLQALEQVEILTCGVEWSEGSGELASVAQGGMHVQGAPKVSGYLKRLIINDSHKLISFPIDVSSHTNLLELDLEFCSKLQRIPADIENFRRMEVLNLAWCISLEALPFEIGSLNELRYLSVVACSKLETLPKEIGKLRMLKKLKMDHCAGLKSLPREILNLESLTHLSMSWCTGLGDSSMRFNLSNLPKTLKLLNITGLNPKLLEHLVSDLKKADRMPTKLVKDISSKYTGFWQNFLSEQPEETEKSAQMLARLFKSDYGPTTN